MAKKEQPLQLDRRAQVAVAELQQTISDRSPTAQFEIAKAADDPDIVHLVVTVDLDDPDEVGDLVIERELQLQVDEGIPMTMPPMSRTF